jgi:putative sigma-54 modulation protein
MNIHLTGHHLEITPSLKEYIETKLAKIFHHFDHVIDAKVTLTVNKLEHIAEATIHAECRGENMYTAIDLLSDKLDRQVIKYKELHKDHHRVEGGLKHQPIE